MFQKIALVIHTSLWHVIIFDSSSSFTPTWIPQSTWETWSCVFNTILNPSVTFSHILELPLRSQASSFPLLYETFTFTSALTPHVSSLTRRICWFEFQLCQWTGWPRSSQLFFLSVSHFPLCKVGQMLAPESACEYKMGQGMERT